MSTTLILDGFSGTSGATLNGRTPDTTDTVSKNWTNAPTHNWKIYTDTVQAVPSTGGAAVNAQSIDSTKSDNLQITATNIQAGVPSQRYGVFLRGDGTDNNQILALIFQNNGSGAVEIWKTIAGTYTMLATSPVAFSLSTPYTLVLTVSGSNLTATFNGATVNFTSALLNTNTFVGIWSNDANCLIDSFTVVDTSASAPVANFSGTPLTGTEPLSVTFTDSSTNTPTSWLWEKNKGAGWVSFAGTPTAQNPTESFAYGTWSVRLTATNSAGSNTKTQTNYLVSSPATSFTVGLIDILNIAPPFDLGTVDAPVADFSGTPLSGPSPITVVFTDLSKNSPTTWLWQKSNGGAWVNFASSSSQNPTETFGPGIWSVRLTATNATDSSVETKKDYITSKTLASDLSQSLGMSIIIANGADLYRPGADSALGIRYRAGVDDRG